MITPDAKCVVNGPKLNEVIGVVNDMLNVMVSEEFEVVESSNIPGKRAFVIGQLSGQKQQGANAARNTISGNSSTSSRNRNNLTSTAPASGTGAAGAAGDSAAPRPSAVGAASGAGGARLPQNETEYRELVNRLRTGQATQEDRNAFQAMQNLKKKQRADAQANRQASRDPLVAQLHAKRQAAANRVAEENRMVWTYGQTGSKASGANWLTKYTDNGGIYQR